MEYLIVDGYNIINAWDDIFDLKTETMEECRSKLLHILSNYQGFKKIKVIVVFDAYQVKSNKEKIEAFDNLEVIFTKENEIADSYIERLVYKMSSEHIIRVATSDYLEQTLVLSMGGSRLSPRELKKEIELVNKNFKSKFVNAPKEKNTIMSNVRPEQFEILEKMRRGKF